MIKGEGFSQALHFFVLCKTIGWSPSSSLTFHRPKAKARQVSRKSSSLPPHNQRKSTPGLSLSEGSNRHHFWSQLLFVDCLYTMVNATKGLFITCDIPMAQFIINMNSSLPASQKFIIHVLDSTHLFVQPHVAEMIRSAIVEFRDQNSYEKPA
ncbi:hypothetical protein NE237_021470 [Protea cynaroides]|uniref:General transcription and DNA repair factor IIH subunit TFB5 n=1 Tax=Protea cynaroides TaxID=273540 RepID=A0A9Q0H965_9MAGN|nr:hypothetical protein NE237_021470 [Protea cynaroides]